MPEAVKWQFAFFRTAREGTRKNGHYAKTLRSHGAGKIDVRIPRGVLLEISRRGHLGTRRLSRSPRRDVARLRARHAWIRERKVGKRNSARINPLARRGRWRGVFREFREAARIANRARARGHFNRGFLVSIHDSVFAISANAFVADLRARPRAL